MLARTLAFAAGIFLLLQFQKLPSITICLFLPVMLILAWRFPLCRLPACLFFGFVWALVYSQLFIEKLPPSLEQTELMVQGEVVSLPVKTDRYQRFHFNITHIIEDEINEIITLPVRLSWYQTKTQIKPGQRWQFKIKLKRPYGFQNPGGFDYELWLLRQGINATGYIKQSNHNILLYEQHGVWLQRLRYYFANHIKTLANDKQGLLLALAIGDRSGLTVEERERLNVTGTTHLIAISGLHLGIVATFVFFLARVLWSRSRFLTDHLSAPLFASIAAFMITALYAAIAGFSLPTQRALTMIACVLVSVSAHRPISIANTLSFAALFILIMDPFALLAGDFWLSFIAVVAIIFLTKNRQFEFNKLNSWLFLQFGLFLCLTPLLVVIFNRLLLFNIAANIIAIPIIGMLVVPGLLLAMCLMPVYIKAAALIIHVLEFALDMVWRWLALIEQSSVNHIHMSEPSIWALLFSLLGVFILLMPRGLPGRWLGLVFILPLFLPIKTKLKDGEFDFTLLDVGQGLAAVILTREHALLFDAGAKYSDKFDIGSAVVLPFLRQQGIRQLDSLIISHGDNDHIGGADSILSQLNTNAVLSSVPEQLGSKRAALCMNGQHWEWDGVTFIMLHPEASDQLSENDRSCVLKIISPYGSLLLTGDIEKQAEQLLVSRSYAQLSAQILLVPHHGSKTSSSDSFIDAVNPKYALISAGYRNRFGLPNQDILSRYEQRGIQTLTTFQSGAISIQFRQTGNRIQKTRTEQRRFWHNTAANNSN